MALAAILAVYSSVMAASYLKASGEAGSLRGKVEALSKGPTVRPPDFAAQLREEESSQQQLDDLRKFFTYPDTDTLAAAISATAQQTSVKLERIDMGGSRVEQKLKVQYVVQPITLAFSGDTTNIYLFLSALHEKMPAGKVSSVALSGQYGAASAQVQMLLYLSPEAAPSK